MTKYFSSIFLQILLLIIIFTLAACGFTPLYGKKNQQYGKEMASIGLPVTNNQDKLMLIIALKQYLNPQNLIATKDYQLDLDLEVKEAPASVQQDTAILRYNIDAEVKYRLKNAEGIVVKEGKRTATVSYNSSNSDYSTYTSEQYSKEKLLGELAKNLEYEMIGYFMKK